MLVNRVSGLVAPYSLKFLFDNVIGKHQAYLLPRIVLAVVGATIVQGMTSYSLTQLLSKSSQRMITELRVAVQAHIGRLPVSFYDANKTGVLVSRIMSDVEGIRNLIGTGLVDFVGGIVTAILALGYLLHVSVSMTAAAFVAVVIFGLGLSKAFKTIRPMYRARPKLNAEVTGRLTESLGGVRVVKGYHAEEREEKVFQGGVQKLLDNVLQTLTATSLMSFSATALMGIVTASMMFLGARNILAGTMSVGLLISYMAFLAFLIAPVAQIASVGPQMTEALAGLERTREVLSEKLEDQDPQRTERLDRVDGPSRIRRCGFRLRSRQTCSAQCEFRIRSRHFDGACRAIRRRKIHDHRPDCGVLCADRGPGAGGRSRSGARAPRFLSHAARSRVAGNVSFRRHDSRERGFCSARRAARKKS